MFFLFQRAKIINYLQIEAFIRNLFPNNSPIDLFSKKATAAQASNTFP